MSFNHIFDILPFTLTMLARSLPLKKNFLWTFVVLFLVFLLSLVIYREISLLHFINLSFYVSGGLLMLSLLTLVIQKGFFDAIFLSFRSILERGDNKDEETPLSALISYKYNTLLSVGLLLLLIMLGALFLYYL